VSQELFDQMNAVITRNLRLHGGAFVHSLEFLHSAHHWRFTRARGAHSGGQTKGQSRAPGSQPA
jgi:hypothetical protein